MTERLLVLLCAALAGGVGAVARFVLDGAVTAVLARRGDGMSGARGPGAYPWGITAVNLSGSFAIGILGGALAATNPLVTVLGVGLLGGYTTFSTASVDTVRLLRSRRVLAGLANGVGQLAAAVLAAALGAWLGSILA